MSLFGNFLLFKVPYLRDLHCRLYRVQYRDNYFVRKAEKVIEKPDPLENEVVDYPRWLLSLYEVI